MRPRSASALRTSAWRWDSLLVIFWAASGSSHRDGAAACSSSAAMSALQLVEVEDGLDRPHGRGEGLQLFGNIDDCHGSSVTAVGADLPRAA